MVSQELAQIAKEVSKIRIEIDNQEPYEKEFKKDKFGAVIVKDLKLLKQAQKTKTTKESFEDDF